MPEFPPTMIVCVGSVVLQKEKVLLARQTYGESLKGKWTIPWGFVQGETPETHNDPVHIAALREISEEAGIIAEIEGLLGIQNGGPSKENIQRLYILFLCRHISGEPAPDYNETDQAGYYSYSEIGKMQAEIDPFCFWLTMRVLTGNHTVILPNAENPYPPNLAFL